MVVSLAPSLNSETPYTRAVNHVRRRKSVTAAELKRDMGLSPSVARSYLASMQSEGIIAAANELQRHLVLKPLAYVDITARAQETAVLVMKVSEQTGIGPGTILRAAEDGTLRQMLDECGPAVLADARRDAPDASAEKDIGRAARGRLRSYVERVINVEEDQAVLADDKKEIYSQAKGEGFDTKALRRLVKYLKLDKTKLEEEDAMFDLYLAAYENGGEVLQ